MPIKTSQAILKCYIDLKSSVWFTPGSEDETVFCDTWKFFQLDRRSQFSKHCRSFSVFNTLSGYRPYSHSEQFKSIKIREDICARYFGGTPLIAAARRWELDCVKELLRYNANIEASGRNVAEDINNWEVDGTAYYRTPVDDQNGTAFLQPLSKNMLKLWAI